MLSRRRLDLVSLFLAACLCPLCFPSAALSQDKPTDYPWEGDPLSADPRAVLRAVSVLPPPKNPDVDVVLLEWHVRFDDQGRTTLRYRHIYRALSRSVAESWGNTEWRYAPWHQERPEVQARVITPDGQSYLLDPKTVVEVADDSGDDQVFSHRRVLRAPLPGMEAGVVVEEVWHSRDARPFFADGTLSRYQPFGSTDVRTWRLIVEHPANLALKTKVIADQLEPKREQHGQTVRLTFEKRDVSPVQHWEPLLPHNAPRSPVIASTTGRSWAEVAAGYARLVDSKIDPEDVKPLLQATLQGTEAETEKIAKLLATIRRQVRYVSVSFGESALAPANCLATLTRRYGDCKDQSTLLVSLLRAAGIEAHVALIHSGGNEDVPADLPAVNHFNHAIVYVPGDKPLWIDPTAAFTRAGELPVECQGKLALICAPATQDLVRTPASAAADNRTSNHMEITVVDGDPGKGKYRWEYHGAEEARQRHVNAQWTTEGRRKSWDEWVSENWSRAKIDRLAPTPADDLSRPFSIELDYSGVEDYKADGEAWSYSIQPTEVFEDFPLWVLLTDHQDAAAEGEAQEEDEKPKKPRQHDYFLPRAHQYESSYRFVPPPDFTVKALPESDEIKLGPATCGWSTTRDGEIVTVVVRFDSGPQRWSPDDVSAFRKAYATLNSSEGEKGKWPLLVEFEHRSARLLREGQYREAFDVLQRAVSQSPDSYAAKARLQRFLAEAHLFEHSSQLAERIVAEHPERWDAWYRLGHLRLCNAIGQLRLDGLDIPKATTALRKSVELAPNEPSVRLALAECLKFDERGRQFGDEARLRESVELLEKLIDDPAVGQEALLQLFAKYLVLERFADLQRVTGKLAGDDRRLEAELIVAAVKDGLDAAARLAVDDDDEQRARMLARAGSDLEFARQYELAAGMFELAARASRNEDYADIARRLKQSKRYDLASIPPTDPRCVVQTVAALGITTAWTRRDLAHLLEGDLDRFEGSLIETQMDALDEVRATLERRGSPAAIQDRLAHAEYVVEGNDEAGYRIELSLLATQTRWFVVRKDGQYRLLLLPNMSAIGRHALDRLTAGDQAGARLWLDWAVEPFALRGSIFDAYSTPPFARLWSMAKRDSESDFRLALNALAADAPDAKAIEELAAARKDESSTFKKLQIDRALIGAYLAAGRPQDAEELIQPLLARQPGNPELVSAKAQACQLLGKADEIKSLLSAQLARRGANINLLARLANELASCGKYDETLASFDGIEKYGPLTADACNVRGWAAAFIDGFPDKVLEDARKAASSDQGTGDYATLHTVATLQAHRGQPIEAMETLHQAVMARPEKSLTGHDWYVVGRVAEVYGLSEYARRCYERVTPEELTSQTDTHVLAKQRLKSLPSQ